MRGTGLFSPESLRPEQAQDTHTIWGMGCHSPRAQHSHEGAPGSARSASAWTDWLGKGQYTRDRGSTVPRVEKNTKAEAGRETGTGQEAGGRRQPRWSRGGNLGGGQCLAHNVLGTVTASWRDGVAQGLLPGPRYILRPWTCPSSHWRKEGIGPQGDCSPEDRIALWGQSIVPGQRPEFSPPLTSSSLPRGHLLTVPALVHTEAGFTDPED